MSYDSKIQSARQIIEDHNSVVDQDHQIDFEEFLENLRNAGGTSEETLKAVSWEDLEKCGAPTIMAKSLSHVFRKSSEGDSKVPAYVSTKKASTLTPKELVERYNPKDVKNSVGKRLKDLSDGKRFVVFHDNGKVNVDETVKLLEDIMSGLEEVDTTFINCRPFPVYKIGERLDAYAEENPIYPGRALRREMTCDQTGRSWEGVSLTVRQILYLARTQTKELQISSLDDAHNVIDKALSDSGEVEIRQRYKNASILFDDLSKTSQLPSLKIKIGTSGEEKDNNPFGFGSNRTF